MCRYQVEYEFVDTKNGKRPMEMQGFNTKEDAKEFASTKEDANIVEIISAWKFTETGKMVQIW